LNEYEVWFETHKEETMNATDKTKTPTTRLLGQRMPVGDE
jgi:hypothetical protein